MAKCPSCGGQLIRGEDGIHYTCSECGHTFKKKVQQTNTQDNAVHASNSNPSGNTSASGSIQVNYNSSEKPISAFAIATLICGIFALPGNFIFTILAFVFHKFGTRDVNSGKRGAELNQIGLILAFIGAIVFIIACIVAIIYFVFMNNLINSFSY